MMLIRYSATAPVESADQSRAVDAEPEAIVDAPLVSAAAPTVEQTVREWHDGGRSQRAIARELSLDRRKVKRILDNAT